MKESSFQQRIQKTVRQRGGWAMKVHGGIYGRKGANDIVVCYRGYFLGIEAKVEDNEPTKLQQHEIELVRKARGVSLVVRSYSELCKILDVMDTWPLPPEFQYDQI
jgi:Holliday junction resolvase